MKLTVAYASLGSGSPKSFANNVCRCLTLLILGFCVGIIVHESGLLYETIRVRVSIIVVDKENTSREDVLKEILSYLPQSDQSLLPIPDIAHFFWSSDGRQSFPFVDYLSVLSIHRHHRPRTIWFHCDQLPDRLDPYWSRLWQSIPITVVHQDIGPTSGRGDQLSVVGQEEARNAHIIEVLLKHGGIFIDRNVIVVNSLEKLRHHNSCVIVEDSVHVLAMASVPKSAVLSQFATGNLTALATVRSGSGDRCLKINQLQLGDSAHHQLTIRIPAQRRDWSEAALLSANDTIAVAARKVLSHKMWKL